MCSCGMVTCCLSRRGHRKSRYWARFKVQRHTSIVLVSREMITSPGAVERRRGRIESGFISFAPMVMSCPAADRDGLGARGRLRYARAIQSSCRSTRKEWRHFRCGLPLPRLFITSRSRYWRYIASRHDAYGSLQQWSKLYSDQVANPLLGRDMA